MLNSPHTPGPWRPNNGVVEIANGMALVVATCGPVNVGYAPKTDAERLANARLIAAAPEMLEALRKATVDLETVMEALNPEFQIRLNIEGSITQARAIIAKLEV